MNKRLNFFVFLYAVIGCAVVFCLCQYMITHRMPYPFADPGREQVVQVKACYGRMDSYRNLPGWSSVPVLSEEEADALISAMQAVPAKEETDMLLMGGPDFSYAVFTSGDAEIHVSGMSANDSVHMENAVLRYYVTIDGQQYKTETVSDPPV